MNISLKNLMQPIVPSSEAPYKYIDYLNHLDDFNEKVIKAIEVDTLHPRFQEELVDVRSYDIRFDPQYHDLENQRPRNLDMVDPERAMRFFGEDSSARASLVYKLAIANSTLLALGFRLILRSGFRSREFQKLIIENHALYHGGEFANQAFVNGKEPPHSTGGAVDIVLWDIKRGREAPTQIPAWVRGANPKFNIFSIEKFKNYNQEAQEVSNNLTLLTNALLYVGIVTHIRVLQESHHKVWGNKQAKFLGSFYKDVFGTLDSSKVFYDVIQ